MKILIILTNQKKIGNSKIDTGFHFSEFSHPYEFFVSHGYEVFVGSPNGGECPITSPHPEDKINASFYDNPEKMKIVKNTNGNYLVSGKRLNSFTNAEEEKTQFAKDVPFLLETKLIEQGALFESSGIRESHLAYE